jgi:hypothetical protein
VEGNYREDEIRARPSTPRGTVRVLTYARSEEANERHGEILVATHTPDVALVRTTRITLSEPSELLSVSRAEHDEIGSARLLPSLLLAPMSRRGREDGFARVVKLAGEWHDVDRRVVHSLWKWWVLVMRKESVEG